MNDKPTIILSRTDSIGDVVLTLPMAGLIRKKLPHCRIIFLGRNYTRDVVSLSIHVDEFVSFDDISGLPEPEQVKQVRSLKADMIIHVFPSPQIASLAKKAAIPIRVGTTNRLFHWLTCNRLVRFSRRRSDLHEAQLNLKLVTFLGIENPPLQDLHFYYGFSKIPSLNEEFRHLIDKDSKNIILHPRSRGSAMEWGLDNFARLIDLLPSDKYRIFICGTAEDGKLITPLKGKKSIDLTGKFSLQQYIAFIAQCDVLIAASTGPLHIAAALNIRAIGLFSPKRPIHPGRWAPLGKHATTVVFDNDCESCRKNKFCNCIQDITSEQVINLIES